MSPGRGLHEEAERRNADLIVVGSSSRSLLGRVWVGDDARASLNGAPSAVAIAARSYAQHQRYARCSLLVIPRPTTDQAAGSHANEAE
jgi:hypothetical protein